MAKTLNKEQLEAIEHYGSPLLVTAGPGSGKTYVITERVKFLLKKGIEPSAILCLTFSEKAAASIKKKLEDDSGIIASKTDLTSMRISTYHSFLQRLSSRKYSVHRNWNAWRNYTPCNTSGVGSAEY